MRACSCRNGGSKRRVPPFVPHDREGAVMPMDEVVSRYFVRLAVVDKPGVFAKIADILATAADFKRSPASAAGALAGRSVCMLFEKPSLRTRMSFEVGCFRMGAQAIYLDHKDTPLGTRESIADYGHKDRKSTRLNSSHRT